MNVVDFYVAAQEFQDKRNAISQEHSETMRKIRTAKGSEYYDKSAKNAGEKKAAALSALKAEFAPRFNSILDSMEATNAARSMKAPTPDELGVLQVLKMKENITKADLDMAANSLKNNPACLTILSEIARKNEIFTNYDGYGGTELSVQAAGNLIDALRNNTIDFLNFDTPRAARLYAQHRERFYGENTEDVELPARQNFSDPDGCFAEIGGMDAATVSALEAAVG